MDREKIDAIAKEIYGSLATEQELRFAAAIRSATKEEDARICDTPWNGDADTYDYSNACNECASAIRASK